jgi:hypothetical protein
MSLGQPDHAPPRTYDPPPIVTPLPVPRPAIDAVAAAPAQPVDAETGATLSELPPVPERKTPAVSAYADVTDETTGSIPELTQEQVMAARTDRLDRVRGAMRGVLADEAGAEDAVPLPKPRPIQLASVAPMLPAELSNVMTKKPRIAPADDPYCQPQMASLGAQFSALAPIEDGPCGIEAPIKLVSIGAGDDRVKLSPAATVDCRVGSALARWLNDDAQPAAQTAFNARITGLKIAASYSCRPRDNIKGAPLSEHSFGNAIDISAFRVGEGKDAQWIEVGPREDADAPDAKFLTEIRADACGPFRTVLGPGSDSYHTNHFHFDLAQRNKNGKRRGLYCD